MGIKKLSKYTKENNLYTKINLEDLAFKKIAIDISVLLYQIIISIRNSGDDLRNNKGEITSHILGLFNKTVWLIQHNIIPIFVFDGKSPEFKKHTIKNRKLSRIKAQEKLNKCTNNEDRIKYLKRTVSITKTQIKQSKELLDLMGIPYLQATGEADILCAKLSAENIVDYVLTEDMDILTFGASKIIKNLFKKNRIEIVDKLKLLKYYDLTYNQFVITCILLGCDYHTKNLKINISQAVNLSRSYQYFTDIEFDNKILSKNIIQPIFYYFSESIYEYDLTNFKIILNLPNNNLLNILVKKYNLIKSRINWKVEILNNKLEYLKSINF